MSHLRGMKQSQQMLLSKGVWPAWGGPRSAGAMVAWSLVASRPGIGYDTCLSCLEVVGYNQRTTRSKDRVFALWIIQLRASYGGTPFCT